MISVYTSFSGELDFQCKQNKTSSVSALSAVGVERPRLKMSLDTKWRQWACLCYVEHDSERTRRGFQNKVGGFFEHSCGERLQLSAPSLRVAVRPVGQWGDEGKATIF